MGAPSAGPEQTPNLGLQPGVCKSRWSLGSRVTMFSVRMTGFFKPHMEVRSYGIALSDLFHLAKCPQCPSMVLQFSSFSRLHDSPLYVQTMLPPSPHPLRGSWVASMSLTLQWRRGADSSSLF